MFYHQLCEIKNGGDQSNSPQGNAIVGMKFQKQQRHEVRRNCLGDEAQITGFQCSLIIVSHFISPQMMLLRRHELYPVYSSYTLDKMLFS